MRNGVRRLAAVVRRVTLCGCLISAPLAAAVPQLILRAPAELSGMAGEIASWGPDVLAPAVRLSGLAEPGGPIQVVLVPESAPGARTVPPWISGFADETASVVVLLPARVARYPDRGLPALLQHEVMHVLVYRAAGGRPVPRWFDEGLAMAAGREADLGDRARVALAVLGDGRLPLARIDAAFSGNGAQVAEAYALARDFVDQLLRRFGDDVGARILAGVARGATFEAAFAAATGSTLSAVETAYWRHRTLWDRWVPVVTSSVTLWGAITLFALVAFRRRRTRDDRIRRRWEQEELELESKKGGEPGAPAADEEELVN
jgi:hypothetical protein